MPGDPLKRHPECSRVGDERLRAFYPPRSPDASRCFWRQRKLSSGAATVALPCHEQTQLTPGPIRGCWVHTSGSKGRGCAGALTLPTPSGLSKPLENLGTKCLQLRGPQHGRGKLPTSNKRTAGQGGVATVVNKHPGYRRKADRLVMAKTTQSLFPSRAGRNSGRDSFGLF